MANIDPRTQELIKQVRRLMKAKRITQAELADVIQKSPRTVQARLQGLSPFELEEIWDIEDHFGVVFIKGAPVASTFFKVA